MVHNHYDVIC